MLQAIQPAVPQNFIHSFIIHSSIHPSIHLFARPFAPSSSTKRRRNLYTKRGCYCGIADLWRTKAFSNPHTSSAVTLTRSGSNTGGLMETTKFAQMLVAWEARPSVRDTDIAFPRDKSCSRDVPFNGFAHTTST